MSGLWFALSALAVVLALVAGICAGFLKEYRPPPPKPPIHYCTPERTDELCRRARARIQADTAPDIPSALPAR